MANHRDDKREELIVAVRDARSRGAAEEFVAAADALKAYVPHREFAGALREALPEVPFPTQYLSRKRRQARRRREDVHDSPSILADSAAELYQGLRQIRRISGGARGAALARLSAKTGIAERTLQKKLGEIARDGAETLNRKPRSDAGKVKVAEEVREAFLDRRTSKHTRHESVSISIDRVREQFPDVEISEHSLRRLARSIPKAVTMPHRQWRERFLPGRNWEVPHPNHTHVFDMTIGDVFVWDQDPEEKPYRPHLTAIVDEYTHCCMFGIYTKEPPSRAVLQSVLLHAWLPKPDAKWPQYGPPLHLHCDNGKVQDSDWLEVVCRTLGSDLNLCGDVRHTDTRSPWQQGHIERFFGIVHERLESQLGACYCGRSPEHRREGFKGSDGGPKDWQQYPTLEALNYAFRVWVVADYHQLYHRRLKMTRFDAWQLHSDGHIRLPDADYLYSVLLQRADKRKVRGGRVQVNTYSYWHRSLQGYEETQLEVRWDPADLTRVMVFDYRGQFLCWAEREEKKFVDDPKDLAEHRQRQREVKAEKKALAGAVAIAAPTDEGTFQRHVKRLHEEHEKRVIPFRRPATPEGPEADQAIDDEETLRILTRIDERDEKDEKDDKFSLHGIEI